MRKMLQKQVAPTFLLGITGVALIILPHSFLKPGAPDRGPKITQSIVKGERFPFFSPSSSASPGKVTWLIRTAAKPPLMYQLYCMLLRSATFFLPASLGEIVVVLDEESAEDHKLGSTLLRQFKLHFPEYELSVLYEREPKSAKVWKFNGYRDPGYNRQLYSSFITDRYGKNDIVMYVDTDTQFRVPMTQKWLMPGGKLKVFGARRPRGKWMAYWIQSTEKAIGLKFVSNFMVTFPQAMYRDTITNCRKHILRTLNVSNIEAAIPLFYGQGQWLSPINMIMHYAWYFERDRYDWHLAVGKLRKANKNINPKHRILPSDTIPDIVGVPHVVSDKKWNESLLVPGYCASMTASGVYIPGCKKVAHDYKRLCDYHSAYKRFWWPGVGRMCREGKLAPCCRKAAEAHFRDVASLVESGILKFNRTRPMLVQSLAKDMGVECEPLILP